MRIKGSVLAGLAGMAVFLGGCCQKYIDQIDQLTQERQDLEGQLQTVRDGLAAKDADLNQCRDDLSAAKNEVTALQAALDKAREEAKLPKGWQVQKGMIMTSLPTKVLFAPGKAKLKSGATISLKRILADIKANFPTHDIYIIGHTDSDPIRVSGWKDNLELSLQRAASVARYMIRQGMSPKQLIAGGCGEHRPVASNSTSSGKARNRRVEFWVLKPM